MADAALFLTDEQRKLLRSASQGRESSSELQSPRAPKQQQQQQHQQPERRSHSGRNGRPKKGGNGGKGTWGSVLEDGSQVRVDRNDPNYDSDEEPYKLVGAQVAQSLEVYKEKVVYIVDEYFAAGSVGNAATELRDLGSPNYHHYFVKKLISIAMDRHDREKEMASVLLSALYADVIEAEQLSKGFVKLLESVEDLALDIPDAVDVLALFLARAVVDDILPPAFLSKARVQLPASSKGAEAISIAEKSFLSAPLHAEVVEMKWGGRTQTTVAEAKKEISELLRELAEGGDEAEARRRIRELNLPFFHHELVKRALTLAIERAATPCEQRMLSLLAECADEGLISSSQMSKGFGRMHDAVDDLRLDVPRAADLLRSITARAVSEGWLPATYSAAPPPSTAPPEEDTDAEAEAARAFKRKATVIIQEYFMSDDVAEVACSLEELAAAEMHPVFLKRLLILAMERRNREREMASVLLSELYGEVVSGEHIRAAFAALLESAEDTALDVPDAATQLAFFLARAVVDDVLPPLHVEEIGAALPDGCDLGQEIVRTAGALLAARHAGERVLRCWGGGGGGGGECSGKCGGVYGGGGGAAYVEEAKDKMVRLLEELEAGGEVGEACAWLRELGLPHFHHEVVKRALVMGMDRPPAKERRLLRFLHECAAEGLITASQMVQGFRRVAAALDDLALDVPDARVRFRAYVAAAQSAGWLTGDAAFEQQLLQLQQQQQQQSAVAA